MKLYRRHYAKFAEVIKESGLNFRQKHSIATKLADILCENQQFRRENFILEAIGDPSISDCFTEESRVIIYSQEEEEKNQI